MSAGPKGHTSRTRQTNRLGERKLLGDERPGLVAVLGRKHERQRRPHGIVRGADKQWLRDLYGYAVVPDLVFYLKLGVHDLVPRVLQAGKMNYWESGMDMNYGDDLYDSFMAYQGALIEQFDLMAEEEGFVTVDARSSSSAIQAELRRVVSRYLRDVPVSTTLDTTRQPNTTATRTS